MPRRLPLGGFQCVREASQFNEDFTKSSHEDSDIVYFLESDVQYP